jgi:hypothetical protein
MSRPKLSKMKDKSLFTRFLSNGREKISDFSLPLLKVVLPSLVDGSESEHKTASTCVLIHQ